jgi:hypothetical protein
MKRSFVIALVAIVSLVAAHRSRSDEPTAPNSIVAAVERAEKVLSRAIENYPKHRDCFSCHHHTLPLLAMREMGSAAITYDKERFAAGAEFTRLNFSRRIDKLREGRGIGGQAATVSYGLWTLDIAGVKPDDTTAAMVEFLLKTQRDDGRWAPPSNRPPLEESHITTTALAAYYMPRLCADEQRDAVEKSVLRARKWLADAPAESHEDHVFRLWALLQMEDASDAAIAKTIAEYRDELLAAQRDDGGWSQLSKMESDAYATGQAIYVLRRAGVPINSIFIKRGVEFLLRTQHDDGSWLVATRSRPVQVFFDNGDPHGKSQFISIAATSWAVAALAASIDTALKVSRDERDDRIVFSAGGNELAHFVFKDKAIPRPYLAELKSARGAQLTRNHPPREGDAQDHATFHPGLWLAFGNLGGADSWRLKAKVEVSNFVKEFGGDAVGREIGTINRYWSEDRQRVICTEVARHVWQTRPHGMLLTVDAEFSSDDADFAFGDQEEMGLGVRMHTPLTVAAGKGGRILDAAGNINEKNVWGKSSPWCDYAGPLDGRFVGVMIMSHPKNFRPPWWHVRDYGLMVANPFGKSALGHGERSSVVVKRGEKFRWRLGVLLHDHANEKEFDPEAAFIDYTQQTAIEAEHQ